MITLSRYLTAMELTLLCIAFPLQAQNVLTGADVLLRDSLHIVAGKRVGLIINHTSLLNDGRSLLDTLHANPAIRVIAVFSPEHGFRGSASAGELVPNDGINGIPIHSLYGARRKPTAEMLEGLDMLLFDIQDIGVRYYTYISTMLLCLEAAADAGVEFVVLDRPNPLGGEAVEGPIRAPKHRSFVAMLPIPVRHGMTAAELALMAYAEGWLRSSISPHLRIVPMHGWERRMYHSDTGLPWVNPSPNMVSMDAALAYVGTCLLEGTSVSEGRGTDIPFLCFGAPFVDGAHVAERLNTEAPPGVLFHPVTFTPHPRPGAGTPKFVGEECHGAVIEIVDRAAVQPFEMGLLILDVLARLYGEKIGCTSYLSTLIGHPGFTEACVDGRSGELFRSLADATERFNVLREKHLLYP